MRQLAGRFRNGSWPIYCHNYFFAHSKHSWELWPNFRTSSWDIFMSHECTDLCAPVQKKMFKSMFTFVQRLTPCVSSEELNCLPWASLTKLISGPFYSVKVFHLFFQVAAETYFDCVTVRNSFYQTRYCAELWSEHKILWLNLRTQSFELSSLSIDLCFVVSEVKILWKEA